VDRRIIVKLLVTFYERGQSGDVMRLMASMLDFTPDDKRKVRGSENATKGHGRTKPARGGGLQRCTSCESLLGISGVGEPEHAAVTQRPPITLYTMVPRTHTNTFTASVWDVSIVQGPFSVAPVPNLTLRFATC
jgi:hypothetical protein